MFKNRSRSIVLIGGETCLLIAAVVAGTYLRLGEFAWPMLLDRDGALRVLLIVGVCQVSLHYADLYDLRSIGDTRDLFVRLFHALGASSLILAFAYFWFPDWIIGRGVFLVVAVLVMSLVVFWRLAFTWWTNRVAPRERLLLVGTSPGAVALVRELFNRRQELGVEIVGFVDADPLMIGQPVLNPGVIGTIEDIPSIVRARGVDRVVVSLNDARGKLPMDKLLEMKLERGVTFDHLTTVYAEYTGKIAVENLRPSWLIFSDGFKKTKSLHAAKRVMDVLIAAIGLVLLSPVLLLIVIAIKVTSHGPALYRQRRVGQYGRLFTVAKFRSMHRDAEADTGAVWARVDDNRVTPIGRFLRRTRIDELPQLWNVLTGDMSMVGPRPERPEFVSQLTDAIPFYVLRHTVRPGITGWAQVRYTYGASVEDALEKLQYDLFYIKNLSLSFDVFIMFATLKTVILRRGAQ